MVRRTNFTRIIAACAFIFATAASAGPTVKTLRVDVLYWSMNIPGQVAMRKGLEQEAAAINRDADKKNQPRIELTPYIAGDGSAGIERQIAQMFEAVKRKPDIIIVQPTDNAALAAPLRAANQAGIPVVAYDQYISGGTLAAFVTSDNYQAGYLDGEYLAAHFPDSKELKLILVEYPHVSSTVERANGLLDALRDYRQPFRILKTYEAVEPNSGARAGAQMLRDFPATGSVDAVFSVNDGGGLNIVEALANAGRTEIVVASIDGDPKSVDNIRAKRLTHIDAAQFCGPLGAEAMKIAYALATGKKVAPHHLVPVFPITSETLQLYPGWGGPIPPRFAKPWQARVPYWEGTVRPAK
ncbi:sugar ABC transporter substrate-binding protein [Sulfurimicrobium lacus]|uniref:sugar ABC transporter substrate-binding protein n=1 Tax=Sulfurimicrobium lacus TaxID=2715678 RepID=UPI0018E09150|nr:sugar ABC transporter substrate-binding protein [Sulfurimicrobium lacus]